MMHVVIKKMMKLYPQVTGQGPAVTVLVTTPLLNSSIPPPVPNGSWGDKQVQFPKPYRNRKII
jgi:hypothetical protein